MIGIGLRQELLGFAGAAALVPAAPTLFIVEPVTNPPSFDTDLPAGNAGNLAHLNAAVGDTWRRQIADAADTGFLTVLDDLSLVLDADDLANTPIEVAGLDTLTEGDRIARARLERPAVGNSAWSATTPSFEVPALPTRAYVFRGIQVYSDSLSAVTFSVDIGDAAPDRVVIVNAQSQNEPTISGITVNGTAIAQAVADIASGASETWSGVVATGSGVVSVVVTWVGGAFFNRSMALWTATGLDSTTPQDTLADVSGTLDVAAGDLIFGGSYRSDSIYPSFAGFTQALTEHQAPSDPFRFTVGEAMIAATNAAFSVSTLGVAGTFVTFR